MPKMKNSSTLSTIPRSGACFLHYAVTSLSHPDQGGRVADHIVGGPFSRAQRIDTDPIACLPSRAFRSEDIHTFVMEADASPP
jgi:hypothetical protein